MFCGAWPSWCGLLALLRRDASLHAHQCRSAFRCFEKNFDTTVSNLMEYVCGFVTSIVLAGRERRDFHMRGQKQQV